MQWGPLFLVLGVRPGTIVQQRLQHLEMAANQQYSRTCLERLVIKSGHLKTGGLW